MNRRFKTANWAFLLAVSACLLLFAAGFYALGDAPPGPGQDAMRQGQRRVVQILLIVAVLMAFPALVLGVKSFPAAPKRSLLASILSALLLGFVAFLFAQGGQHWG